MTRMEITEETLDAILHYVPRILLAISLIGLAATLIAMGAGWE